jgi:hypothetical protein
VELYLIRAKNAYSNKETSLLKITVVKEPILGKKFIKHLTGY